VSVRTGVRRAVDKEGTSAMPNGERPAPAFVSLQSGTVQDTALAQHLSQGVLVAPDLVVFPDPPELSQDEFRGVHCLVVPGQADAGTRIALRSLELLTWTGRPICGLGLLAEPVSDVRRHRKRRGRPSLVAGLESDGSVWPALIGLAPEGTGPGTDPSGQLEGLRGGTPATDLGRPLRVTDYADAASIAFSICWWVPWCEPSDPDP